MGDLSLTYIFSLISPESHLNLNVEDTVFNFCEELENVYVSAKIMRFSGLRGLDGYLRSLFLFSFINIKLSTLLKYIFISTSLH